MQEAEEEYELGAGLVEPPQWLDLEKSETVAAEKWLEERKKHKGFPLQVLRGHT